MPRDTFTKPLTKQNTDGSIYMCTPIDPLFLILCMLDKYASSSYRNFQDIVTEEKNEDLDCFRNAEQFMNFELLCDTQVISDNKYWKISEERTLQWLGAKFESLKSKLEEIDYSDTSAVSSFVQIKSDTDKSG